MDSLIVLMAQHIHMSVRGSNLRGPSTYEYSGEIPPEAEVAIPVDWELENPEDRGGRVQSAKVLRRMTGGFEKTYKYKPTNPLS